MIRKQEKAKGLLGFSLLSIWFVAGIPSSRESAEKAIEDLNGTKVEVYLSCSFDTKKFTLKVEWAKDNGRGGEFIKKRKYSKAKYCFECGVRLLFCM